MMAASNLAHATNYNIAITHRRAGTKFKLLDLDMVVMNADPPQVRELLTEGSELVMVVLCGIQHAASTEQGLNGKFQSLDHDVCSFNFVLTKSI